MAIATPMTGQRHGRCLVIGGLTLLAVAGCRPVAPTVTPAPTTAQTKTPSPTATVSPTATTTATPTFPSDALANVAALNLRAGPDVLHPALAAVHQGTPMAVTGRDHLGQWFAVRLPDDTTGWVSAKLVDLRRAFETIPTAPTPTCPPSPTATPQPMDPDLPVVLSPPAVAQGDPFLVRVRASVGVRAVALLGEVQTELLPAGADALAGLLPTGMDTPPGEHAVHITLVEGTGDTTALQVGLTIREAEYPEQSLRLGPEPASIFNPEVQRQEAERLSALCSPVTPERLWQGPWQRPVLGAITSPFAALRTYLEGDLGSRHSGIDMRAAAGTPVVAPAPGRVILAETLALRGGAVVLDHGWGVCSGYFHLEAIEAAVGEMVPTGQRLGTAGSSGLATGPHLHWEVRIRGVPVQPVQFLLRDVAQVP